MYIDSYMNIYLYFDIIGLKRMADLYKRHFEEAAEEVKRLEESLNAVKEISGKQIINLREVHMFIHMYI